MSTDLSLSTGRYSVAFSPLVTSWTALPTVFTPAPYFAASDLSISIFQSMPGSGRPSSRSRMSLRAPSMAATLAAANGIGAESSAESCTWIGLLVGGPARGAVTSMRMPAISAVLARMASMISCAGGRLRQSANSNWMTPMVSSVSSLMPRGCSPMRLYTVLRPSKARTRFSTTPSKRFFSSSERLPRACTMTWP